MSSNEVTRSSFSALCASCGCCWKNSKPVDSSDEYESVAVDDHPENNKTTSKSADSDTPKDLTEAGHSERKDSLEDEDENSENVDDNLDINDDELRKHDEVLLSTPNTYASLQEKDIFTEGNPMLSREKKKDKDSVTKKLDIDDDANGSSKQKMNVLSQYANKQVNIFEHRKGDRRSSQNSIPEKESNASDEDNIDEFGDIDRRIRSYSCSYLQDEDVVIHEEWRPRSATLPGATVLSVVERIQEALSASINRQEDDDNEDNESANEPQVVANKQKTAIKKDSKQKNNDDEDVGDRPILVTKLSDPLYDGEDELQVTSHAGCEVGMDLMLNGDGYSEQRLVIAVGAGVVVIDRAVENFYPVGTEVRVYEFSGSSQKQKEEQKQLEKQPAEVLKSTTEKSVPVKSIPTPPPPLPPTFSKGSNDEDDDEDAGDGDNGDWQSCSSADQTASDNGSSLPPPSPTRRSSGSVSGSGKSEGKSEEDGEIEEERVGDKYSRKEDGNLVILPEDAEPLWTTHLDESVAEGECELFVRDPDCCDVGMHVLLSGDGYAERRTVVVVGEEAWLVDKPLSCPYPAGTLVNIFHPGVKDRMRAIGAVNTAAMQAPPSLGDVLQRAAHLKSVKLESHKEANKQSGSDLDSTNTPESSGIISN